MLVSDPSLLCVIIDCNPKFWGKRKASKGKSDASFAEVLSTLLVFLNSHLVIDRRNTLAVLAANAGQSRFLYPSRIDGSKSSGITPAERFASVSSQVVNSLRKMPSVESTDEDMNASLGGALSMALCYINRIKKDKSRAKLNSRILVISVSEDVSWQYVGILNCVFCAQKLGVAIDSCILSGSDSCFLQQASHITKGAYLRINSTRQKALLQYLLSVFLPDISMRKLLLLPSQETVDFRAVCFCHHKLVSSAFVCSVCLSIFCEPSAVCPTCNTECVPQKLNQSVLADICTQEISGMSNINDSSSSSSSSIMNKKRKRDP